MAALKLLLTVGLLHLACLIRVFLLPELMLILLIIILFINNKLRPIIFTKVLRLQNLQNK